MEFLLKQIDQLPIDDLQVLAKYVNTVYVKAMDDRRNSLGNVFDLSFPEFFAMHPDSHGKTAFGFLFEDYLIHNHKWRKLDKINNPGDAVNHNGVHIEFKYATVIHSQSGFSSVLWNHVTEDTLATDFLLFAHDHRGDGKVYSFHVTKEEAIALRKQNKNQQISAGFGGTRGNWVKLMNNHLVGIGDSPMVPKHLSSKRNCVRISA